MAVQEAGTAPAGRRIMVTGSRGFVGRHLVETLTQSGYPADQIACPGREPACTIRLDLGDAASIRSAVEAAVPDMVYHLAGEASVAQSGHYAAATWQANFVGTMDLALALAEVNPAVTLLFVSSAEVYGQAFLDGPVDEAVRPAPSSVYAQAKLATEQMLAAVLPQSATLIVARPSNHIGPGQDERFAVPSFARQLALAERAGDSARIQVGNLESERDFMDVRDVVRVYELLTRLYAQTGVRETFNISSQQSRSVRSLLDMLRQDARVASEVVVDPARSRPSEVPVALVGSSRLREMTGWAPTIPMDQTIRDVLNDARIRTT